MAVDGRLVLLPSSNAARVGVGFPGNGDPMARVQEGGFEQVLSAILMGFAILIGILAMEFFNIYSTEPTRWIFERVTGGMF